MDDSELLDRQSSACRRWAESFAVRWNWPERGSPDDGIGIIVGAQVGETSILTRASLAVMNEHAAITLIAAEGAFGTLLLEHDLTEPCLMFGSRRATLNAPIALDRTERDRASGCSIQGKPAHPRA